MFWRDAAIVVCLLLTRLRLSGFRRSSRERSGRLLSSIDGDSPVVAWGAFLYAIKYCETLRLIVPFSPLMELRDDLSDCTNRSANPFVDG